MRRLDFGLGLAALAAAVIAVTVTLMSSSDSTPQAAAQDTAVTLTTTVSPVGCATTTAQLSSDTSTVSPGSEWTFPKSSYVKARANVAEGCTFSHWELDYGGGVTYDFDANPARFLIAEDMTATAHLTVPEVCTQTTLGQGPAQVPDLAKDCNILMAAKDALRGTGTLNWSADTAMTDWDGVTVSGTPSRVTGLALSLRGLTGSVPSKLAALSALRTLDLSWNKLTGSIPAALGNLGELRSLSLYRTSLGGSIPPELGDLAKLEHLSLSQSFLSGAIPAELGRLTSLEGLYLYQNRLTGSIPPELAGLSSLERLFLGGNALTGCVPGVWADVANSDLGEVGLPYCSTMLEYSTYDSTGAATKAGSYSLTITEAGKTSGATTHGDLIWNVTGLVVNLQDADGSSRAQFYNSIAVGDVVEWVPADSEECWQRFKVTAVHTEPGESTRKRFSLEPLIKVFQWCTGPIEHENGILATELRWNPPAARPRAESGIPQMLKDQPVEGPLTVHLAPFSSIVITIPAGVTLVRFTPLVMSSGGDSVTGLEDVKSGSLLYIDFKNGREISRKIVAVEGDPRDLGALFDAITASARRAGGD
ncbi:MAG: hypothetical protein F4Y92_02195 [Dehalococcoidia bacterium]|nr:hypothetical protein [Dehalococcoidia bacterium]